MSIGFDERDRDSVLRDLDRCDEEVRRLAVERIEAVAKSRLEAWKPVVIYLSR